MIEEVVDEGEKVGRTLQPVAREGEDVDLEAERNVKPRGALKVSVDIEEEGSCEPGSKRDGRR